MNYELGIRNARGFTLIELLIVIVIIGILSSILLSNFIGVRQRARDGTRKSDLRQIQAALELHRADLGLYPVASPLIATCGTPFKDATTNTEYMHKVPCDPLDTPTSSLWNNGDYYYDSTDGISYTLSACLENTGDTSQDTTTTSPSGVGTCTARWYVLKNP